MTFLRTIAALSLFGAARAEKCEAGKQDLHVFLYDGSVRDMDPSFFDGQPSASDFTPPRRLRRCHLACSTRVEARARTPRW